jgi:type I restriction enzyme S subunit
MRLSLSLSILSPNLTSLAGFMNVMLVSRSFENRYNTPSRANPEFYGDAIEWIKSDNINTPLDYLTQAEEGLSELGKSVSRIAPSGSILVTCIAGTPSCIGNAAIANRDVAFNQQINALVPFMHNVKFIYTQILVAKKLIQEASTASMKGMVSKSRFEEIRFISPPLPLQKEFAQRVEAVEKLKATHRASLSQLQSLFASLQHRAFRGEL